MVLKLGYCLLFWRETDTCLIWTGSLGKNLSHCTITIFVLFSVLYVNMYKVKKKKKSDFSHQSCSLWSSTSRKNGHSVQLFRKKTKKPQSTNFLSCVHHIQSTANLLAPSSLPPADWPGITHLDYSLVSPAPTLLPFGLFSTWQPQQVLKHTSAYLTCLLQSLRGQSPSHAYGVL